MGVRDRASDVALAHDLERLDVARLREARPVARGRAQELLVEVGAHVGLRAVGADDLELALQVLVDRDEPRGLELDRGRRRLVAVDPRDAARGDERRAVDVAVVLVDVAATCACRRRRVDLVDDALDRARSSRRPR